MLSTAGELRGQQCFLASSEVLQHIVLPHLAAADLLRLGLTCRSLHAWALSLPPTLWQVVNRALLGGPSSVVLPGPSPLTSTVHSIAVSVPWSVAVQPYSCLSLHSDKWLL